MNEYNSLLINLSVFIGLLLIGYFVGGIVEKRHFESILKREEKLLYFPVINLAPRRLVEIGEDLQIENCFFVSGLVVIGEDYFKRILGFLANFFGGRLLSHESLLDRARREAILRLKEKAISQGADMVVNLQLQYLSINKETDSQNANNSVEIMAYGTALKVK
jgi:uncharacterized protein YbjQ (UPF0145 family)